MVDATPNIPLPVPATANKDIKVATPDLIQFDDSQVPVEYMTDLLFENIGGQEIISISRNDTVNGQRVSYNPIKNVAQLGTKFSPLNLFINTGDADSVFRGYPIRFDQKVPEIGPDPSLDEVISVAYIDNTNGNLIVQVIGMMSNEQIEVQVLGNGDALDAIIY
jgi:hypothetical protein